MTAHRVGKQGCLLPRATASLFYFSGVNKEYMLETALLAYELEEDDRNEQININHEVSKAKARRGENR